MVKCIQGIMKKMLLGNKEKEYIAKYLVEIPSNEMKTPICLWLLFLNGLGIPVSVFGVWSNITMFITIVILPLDIWAALILVLRKKYYKSYTLYIGIAEPSVAVIIMLGIIKFSYYLDIMSKQFMLLFLLICIATFCICYIVLIICLKIGYFSASKKSKLPTGKLTASSLMLAGIAFALIRLFPLPANTAFLVAGLAVGGFGFYSHKIFQYILIKYFNLFPPYKGGGIQITKEKKKGWWEDE